MIDLKIVRRALIVGIILTLGLIGFGHAAPWFKAEWLFGAMLVAALSGMLYARDLGRGFLPGMLGGGVLGAACGLTAVGAAHLLGDRPDLFLPYGVMIAAFTGVVGGIFGELDVRLQRKIREMVQRSGK